MKLFQTILGNELLLNGRKHVEITSKEGLFQNQVKLEIVI